MHNLTERVSKELHSFLFLLLLLPGLEVAPSYLLPSLVSLGAEEEREDKGEAEGTARTHTQFT